MSRPPAKTIRAESVYIEKTETGESIPERFDYGGKKEDEETIPGTREQRKESRMFRGKKTGEP